MPETTYTHRPNPGAPPQSYIIWGGVILPVTEEPPDPYIHREVTKP